MQYPLSGPNLGYAVDTMGRLNTMTDLVANATIISGTTYNPANQLLSMTGTVSETRTYNSLAQLTQLVASGVNITYAYPSTQNNGKLASQTDNISGEQVVYTYDALNRLASAQATSNSWGQSYTYDGFGNLTAQNVIAGSAPAYSATYNPATNQPAGTNTTDANGNVGGSVYSGYVYDVENRVVAGGLNTDSPYQYAYAPGNKRVWRGVYTLNSNTQTISLTTDEITFWSVTGQKLATYTIYETPYVFSPRAQPTMTLFQATTNYYFGGKLIKNANGYVGQDLSLIHI